MKDNQIKISFSENTNDRDLIYNLRDELKDRGVYVAISESLEEDERAEIPIGVGADVPDWIKTIFLSAITIVFTFTINSVIQGFFSEIGSEIYNRTKEIIKVIIKNNQKNTPSDDKSFGVTFILKEKQGEQKIQLWYFFLDGVDNDKLDVAFTQIKTIIIDIKDILSPTFLSNLWKIGFSFSNDENRWQIIEIQEHPTWVLEKEKASVPAGVRTSKDLLLDTRNISDEETINRFLSRIKELEDQLKVLIGE